MIVDAKGLADAMFDVGTRQAGRCSCGFDLRITDRVVSGLDEAGVVVVELTNCPDSRIVQ